MKLSQELGCQICIQPPFRETLVTRFYYWSGLEGEDGRSVCNLPQSFEEDHSPKVPAKLEASGGSF